MRARRYNKIMIIILNDDQPLKHIVHYALDILAYSFPYCFLRLMGNKPLCSPGGQKAFVDGTMACFRTQAIIVPTEPA